MCLARRSAESADRVAFLVGVSEAAADARARADADGANEGVFAREGGLALIGVDAGVVREEGVLGREGVVEAGRGGCCFRTGAGVDDVPV